MGADKAENNDGRTPLHQAVWNGHEAAWDKSARTELERMNSEQRDMECRYEAMEKSMRDIRGSLMRSKDFLVKQRAATSWNPFRRT
ncbi:hypothetical protein MAPG_11378 [Magnaporthiopsis poae ATCC 64411]|uniref:Ankyrin repeat protein n=1 Tax=Magnaporthiopsis poae (strain ATCC 64411 / 73-15) TaxID=644358 RepID=A0A0C4EF42_MAGP6|nr:hypothetical protein MAPG_11378 [Magnaporthiopsis poae ATCC 64411]